MHGWTQAHHVYEGHGPLLRAPRVCNHTLSSLQTEQCIQSHNTGFLSMCRYNARHSWADAHGGRIAYLSDLTEKWQNQLKWTLIWVLLQTISANCLYANTLFRVQAMTWTSSKLIYFRETSIQITKHLGKYKKYRFNYIIGPHRLGGQTSQAITFTIHS